MEHELRRLPQCFLDDTYSKVHRGPRTLELKTIQEPLGYVSAGSEKIVINGASSQDAIVSLFSHIDVQLVTVRVFRLCLRGSKPPTRRLVKAFARPRANGVIRLDLDVNAAVLTKPKNGEMLFDCGSNRVYVVDARVRKLIPLTRSTSNVDWLKPDCRHEALDFDEVTRPDDIDDDGSGVRRLFLPTNMATEFRVEGRAPYRDHVLLRRLFLSRRAELMEGRERASKRMREKEEVDYDKYLQLRKIAEEEGVGGDLGDN